MVYIPFFSRKKSEAGRFSTSIIVILCSITAFLFGLTVGVVDSETPEQTRPVTELVLPGSRLPPEFQTGLYKKIWDAVATKSVVKDVARQDLFYGSLKGLVASLNDPYSVFFDPTETNEFQRELDGEFEGIGAEVAIKDNGLVIVAPLPGSPAERAGLKPGDKILAIDKELAFALTLDQAVTKIKGKQGTTVELLIRHRGSRTDKIITIVRAKIIVPNVTKEMRAGVAIVRLYNFGPETITSFNRVRDELLLDQPRGVILDLRNNPGGLLEAAVALGGSWIKKDQIVVKEVAGNGEVTDHQSTGGAELAGIKTVVLVNNGSASAAEILAGALQDARLARVVGEKTFGKGSVQEFEKFSDGSSLKLTVAKWLTPAGRDITKEGIAPDVAVEFPDMAFTKGQDPQLDKALELLK